MIDSFWKFYDITLKTPADDSRPDPVEGNINQSFIETTISGCIVPVSPSDISQGFQIGSFKCYCTGLDSPPVINRDLIVHNSKEYNINGVTPYPEQGLYILELIR